MPSAITQVKVFSATLAEDRAQLGEKVATYIGQNPDLVVIDYQVRQSSDAGHHCLSIILFFAKRC